MANAPLGVILDVDDALVSFAQRATFEYWGAEVRLGLTPTPLAFVSALTALPPTCGLVILNGHGDRRGLLFPDLATPVKRLQPFWPAANATAFRKYCRWPKAPVLVTACELGQSRIAQAILSGGASGYVAPRGSPNGDAALMFSLMVGYWMIARRRPFVDAVARAHRADSRARMFRMWLS